jgi:DNA polymerase I
MRPVLYLIDGHAVAYRQFFGLPIESFTTREGEPTNATFGFTRLLLDIMEKDKPQYLAVSFDMGLSGRDTVYGEYKGTRDKMPSDLDRQITRIMEVVEAFNIPILALDGYEADDVIGTATQQALAEDVRVHIITGDRDILQLLTDNVTVQLPSFKGPDEIYDVTRFVERYGVQPSQLVDMKALMGDNSDNIPGIAGIGEKTAVKLLQEYESLDGIYEHLNEQKGALLKKLEGGRESAYMSYTLAKILTDIPLKLNLPMCVAHEFDANQVLKVFEQVDFRSLRDRLIKMTTPETQSMFEGSAFSDDSDDLGDFSFEDFAAPARAESVVNTVIVNTPQQLQQIVEVLNNAPTIVFDTETTSTDQMAGDLVGISLSVDGKTGYYIPVGHKEGKQLPMQQVLDALRPALENPNIGKVAHNANYDVVVLQRYGIDIKPITFDTMIAEWLLDPLSKNLGLKNLVYNTLRDEEGKNVYMTPITDLIGTGKNQLTMDVVDIDQAAPYAAADAALTYQLLEVMKPRLEQSGMQKLNDEIEMPLVPVIGAMERAGILFDVPYLSELSVRLNAQLAALEQEIVDLSGGYGTFNINSPKQLNDVLFGKLGLPTKGLRKTSHGYSTDAAVLENLRDAHPIVEKIMEYRELSKLKGTYVDALPALINPRTGRVHTSYNQTGSSTGRISSSNPNLQNIPIRTEVGREVRRAVIAPEGKMLLSADYSQVELRILAHITRDDTLVEAFRNGQDIHAATAAAVYGIPLEKVSYDQRSFAKRVNFGLIYGMGSYRLARDSDLTLAEADAFIKTYFERIPGVQEYINSTKRAARQPEGLQTLLGRRREFPALVSGRENRNVLQAEERAAINMPIQGTAADIMKRAMINVYDELQKRKLETTMNLQVHDELVLEVPEDEVEEVKSFVVDIMVDAYPLDPPLSANVSVGKNWRDMKL